jgi:uncharacterized protein (TIGR02246 family)
MESPRPTRERHPPTATSVQEEDAMRFGKPVLLAVGLVALVAVVAWGKFQQPAGGVAEQPKAESAAPAADDAAVRQIGRQFEEAFNKKDAKAMAALWTEGGELTDVDGTVVRGRAALEKMYAESFAAYPKGTGKFDTAEVRALGKNLITAEGTIRFTATEGKKPVETRYSAMFVRDGDRWLTATVREWYPDTPEPDKLTDLAWLVGDWDAKQGDREVRTTYAWGDEKAFIVCTFKVTEKGQVVASGTEIIAKDPSSGQLRGWLFDRSGTLAEATYSRDGEKWVAEITGTTADGTDVEATNAFVPSGTDAFSWVSIDRSAGGQPLPNVAPLKVTRVKR